MKNLVSSGIRTPEPTRLSRVSPATPKCPYPRLPRKGGYPQLKGGLSPLCRIFRIHQHLPPGCQPRSPECSSNVLTPLYVLAGLFRTLRHLYQYLQQTPLLTRTWYLRRSCTPTGLLRERTLKDPDFPRHHTRSLPVKAAISHDDTRQPKWHQTTAYERFRAQYRIPVPNQYTMYTIPLCTIATNVHHTLDMQQVWLSLAVLRDVHMTRKCQQSSVPSLQRGQVSLTAGLYMDSCACSVYVPVMILALMKDFSVSLCEWKAECQTRAGRVTLRVSSDRNLSDDFTLASLYMWVFQCSRMRQSRSVFHVPSLGSSRAYVPEQEGCTLLAVL